MRARRLSPLPAAGLASCGIRGHEAKCKSPRELIHTHPRVVRAQLPQEMRVHLRDPSWGSLRLNWPERKTSEEIHPSGLPW